MGDGEDHRPVGERGYLSLGEPEPDVVDCRGDGLPGQMRGVVRLGDRALWVPRIPSDQLMPRVGTRERGRRACRSVVVGLDPDT